MEARYDEAMRDFVGPRRPRYLPSLLALGLLAAPACSAAPAKTASESARIVDVLALEPGEVVADVGAGDGEWSEDLAKAVGATGRVLATEVAADELEKLRERIREHGLANVEVISGDQESTGLPAGCCDAILVRMVYHHFQDPTAMRADLHRALRPGGRIAIVDIKPQTSWRHLEGVPERGGHGIGPDELVRDMTASGFSVLSRRDDWNGDEDRYCIVFGR